MLPAQVLGSFVCHPGCHHGRQEGQEGQVASAEKSQDAILRLALLLKLLNLQRWCAPIATIG